MPEHIFPNRNADLRFFVVLIIALCLLFGVSMIAGSRVDRSDHSVPTELVQPAFPPVALKAKSAYVYDVRTEQVLYARDENVRLPLASLTKLMVALVAYEEAPAYGTVTVGREALAAEGDSGLLTDERWSLKDLIDFSLISSSNDGMRAVALSLGALDRSLVSEKDIINDFVVSMNSKASELSLKNTYFWNETGLDESAVKGGAYGSAKDISTLLHYMLTRYPELLHATRRPLSQLTSLDNEVHVARNTNPIALTIPGLLASKTGYTQIAGGNLAFAFDPEIGRPIIVVILGSTSAGRFEDAEELVNATMAYIHQQ